MPSPGIRSVQKSVLGSYSRTIIRKAASVRALFFDVDGVLTDGKIIYSDKGDDLKEFHVRDGLIISHLRKAGLITGIISGRESASVSRRASELKLDFCHQAIDDKSWACRQILKHHKIIADEVAYIGDDLNDLGLFSMVGLSVCPADAPSYIRERADLVTDAKGGRGVVREVGDLILAAQGAFEQMVGSYLKDSKK